MSRPFDLSALVREVANGSVSPHPEAIAKEVLSRIARGQEHAALEQSLIGYVRQCVSRTRAHIPVQHSSGPPKPNSSWKVTGIREAWRKALRTSINVGPQSYKFLADCTADDLTYAEQNRRAHAARNVAAAEEFAGLRGLLVQHGVATVAELPEPVLAATLADAA